MDSKDLEKEITLKEIILATRVYINELLHRWKIIAIVILPFLIYYLFQTYNRPPIYTAETKFFVEGGGSTSGIGGLLGQIGIKSSNGKNNPYKILEVGNSKLLLEKILFTKVKGNKEFLANHILDIYNYLEEYEQDVPEFKDFKFTNDSISEFDKYENIALLTIIYKVIDDSKGEALRTLTFDEEKGVFKILSKTINEDLSLQLNESTYNSLAYYFEELTLQNQKRTRDLLKYKVDSLNSLVNTKMYELAKFGDSSFGLISLTKATQREILQREISGLSMAQIEAYKSFEMADYSLRNQQSQFMLIDKSFKPLNPEEQSLLINIIKALLFGGVLGSLLVIAFKIYKDAMDQV